MKARRGFYLDVSQRAAAQLEWRCPKCSARAPVNMTHPRGWRTGDVCVQQCCACNKTAAHVAVEPKGEWQ